MIVELIAHTVVTGWGKMRDAGWADYETDYDTESGPVREDDWRNEWLDADYLAEFAGRLCYQSWSRPNPATATNRSYLAHILEVGHESVLEHASATFYVAGVSRSLSHELVRHRHLSFSQLSQRFVNENGSDRAMFTLPPAMQIGRLHDMMFDLTGRALEAYEDIVAALLKRGLTRKQAREAARCVLPNATETRFVVTGNMRAWRDVLKRRLDPAADAEIQLFAQRVRDALVEVAPNTFQDMAPQPERKTGYLTSHEFDPDPLRTDKCSAFVEPFSGTPTPGTRCGFAAADHARAKTILKFDYETEGLGGT